MHNLRALPKRGLGIDLTQIHSIARDDDLILERKTHESMCHGNNLLCRDRRALVESCTPGNEESKKSRENNPNRVHDAPFRSWKLAILY